MLKTLRFLLPLYISAALGPLGGFGVVTLLPVLARDWAVDFGTAFLAIAFYMAPFILMLVLSYSLLTYFILFLFLGTGAATAWTSLNTLAVQVSTSMRKPVTSVYNATKFAGYGVAPAVLSIVYGAFNLTGIRYSCMAAVVVSSLLVIKGNRFTDAS